MHIHHLALRVRDFEKSLHFYQTLTELKIHTQFSANGGSIAYLQKNATAVTIGANFPSTTARMAIAVTGVLPVLIVYPFLQKYFVKGVMIGSIKG